MPLLGIEVTPLPSPDTATIVVARARASATTIVGNFNLHAVYMYHTSTDFRAFCDSSDLVLIDGAPVAWAAGSSTKMRVGSTDWIDAFMPMASGLSVLAIGGTEETAEQTQRHMRHHFPSVEWVGVNGYDSQTVSNQLRGMIQRADVVLVGMGMPLQERWILQNRQLLEGKVTANVGGCLDYYAGTQRLAPRWMGRIGVEWLYRLATDPRRLAHRYVIEPAKLAAILLVRSATGQASRQRRVGSTADHL